MRFPWFPITGLTVIREKSAIKGIIITGITLTTLITVKPVITITVSPVIIVITVIAGFRVIPVIRAITVKNSNNHNYYYI